MGRPHQFCARAASRSSRDTRGLEPGAFFIENLRWSPDAKWAGFCFQVAHSSLVAQPAISRSAAPARGRRPPVPRMCQPPQRPDTAMLLATRRLVNSEVVLDSPVSSSRRFAMLTIHALPAGLRRPILVMAFSGWTDAAEAATTAARYLATAFRATKFAEIDPEEFYHFGLSRPYVRVQAGSETEREIIWPSTEFSITQSPELARDLVVGVAAEPHLKWKTYCANALDLARRCEVTLVLTLGALLAEVPHTRPVRLVGGATDAELAARLGVRPTKYEGPTGIVGVLNTICREQGFTSPRSSSSCGSNGRSEPGRPRRYPRWLDSRYHAGWRHCARGGDGRRRLAPGASARRRRRLAPRQERARGRDGRGFRRWALADLLPLCRRSGRARGDRPRGQTRRSSVEDRRRRARPGAADGAGRGQVRAAPVPRRAPHAPTCGGGPRPRG